MPVILIHLLISKQSYYFGISKDKDILTLFLNVTRLSPKNGLTKKGNIEYSLMIDIDEKHLR